MPLHKIPTYSEIAIGNLWKNCGKCEYSRAKVINGKLYCRRKKSPKRMRKDHRVDPDGLCGYHKPADIPF